MNKKPEIQWQFLNRPLAAIVRCSRRNPRLVLARNIRPVLEKEGKDKQEKKSDQHSPAEASGRDKADKKPDGNGVDLVTGGNRNAKSCHVPPFDVDRSDCQQQQSLH